MPPTSPDLRSIVSRGKVSRSIFIIEQKGSNCFTVVMRPLRLFFQLPYNAIGWKAEVELIRRFEVVCPRLGHECFSSSSARDAMDAKADIVFNLHFGSAKVTPIFTAGLVWNPLNFMREAGPNTFLSTLSLDAHLYGGESLRSYFNDFSRLGYRIDDLGNFYPSAASTEFVPVKSFGLPTYVGSLWQDDRHQQLFTRLNEKKAIHGYGTGRKWSIYKEIYKGSFALDAQSYQSIYRQSGIGLCLHSPEHLEDDLPAMRIFEIVASGCVAICDRLPFVEKEFGDTVFYLDHTRGASEMALQLQEIVRRIHARPDRAREMARAAHEIFVRKFSLERLLAGSLHRISKHLDQASNKSSRRSVTPSLQIFTRTRGCRPALLRRALQSLASQTYGRVQSTLVYHGSSLDEFLSEELPRLQAEFPRLEIDVIPVAPTEPLSETMAASIRLSKGDFIGFLDDDDWVFPDHWETLVEALEKNPGAMIAVSGAAVHYEYLVTGSKVMPVSSFTEDIAELFCFEPMDFSRLKRGSATMCSNMLLFRKGINPNWERWPRLEIGEDQALLALIAESGSPEAVFTSRVSCVWSNRQVQSDNQIDRFSEPGFISRTDLFTYRPPVLTRFRISGIGPSSHPWRSMKEKCAALKSLLKVHRWTPRWVRPVFYQRKFNALLVSMIEDWVENRILSLPDSIDLDHLKKITKAATHTWSFRQQSEFDRAVIEILAPRIDHVKRIRRRHDSNIEMARAFDRLARMF